MGPSVPRDHLHQQRSDWRRPLLLRGASDQQRQAPDRSRTKGRPAPSTGAAARLRHGAAALSVVVDASFAVVIDEGAGGDLEHGFLDGYQPRRQRRGWWVHLYDGADARDERRRHVRRLQLPRCLRARPPYSLTASSSGLTSAIAQTTVSQASPDDRLRRPELPGQVGGSTQLSATGGGASGNPVTFPSRRRERATGVYNRVRHERAPR